VNTSNMRQHGTFWGTVSVPCAIVAVVAIIVGMQYTFDWSASARISDPLSRVMNHVLAFIFTWVFAVIGFLPLLNSVGLFKTANKAEADAKKIDQEWYLDENGNQQPGKLWIYNDYGIYYQVYGWLYFVRRWTAAELEERAAQSTGAYTGYCEAWNSSTQNDGTGQ
jgi:hypothetical protein